MLLLSLFYFLIEIALSYSKSVHSQKAFTRLIGITLLASLFLQFHMFDLNILDIDLFNGILKIDSHSLFFQIIFLFLCFSFFFLSGLNDSLSLSLNSNTKKALDGKDLSLVLLFSVLGGVFLIHSNDFFSFFISIELLSFSSYILTSFYTNSSSATAAGVKYFLLGGLASCFLLLGIAFVFYSTGFTNFEAIGSLLSVSSNLPLSEDTNSLVFYFGIVFIVLSLLWKLAASPFHFWAPDIYDSTPSHITAWLILIPKFVLFFMLFKILELVMLNQDIGLKNILYIFSSLSLIIGSIGGLGQYRLKKLLTFSAISHIGFLLMALTIFTENGVTWDKGIFSFFYYLVQYSVSNLCLFLTIISLSYYIYTSSSLNLRDIVYIDQLKGIFTSFPFIAISISICLFSMAGIPPFIGFFGKQFIFIALLQNGEYFLIFLGILSSVISASYYLILLKRVFLLSSKKKHLSLDISSTGYNKDLLSGNSLHYKLNTVHSIAIALCLSFIVFSFLDPNLLIYQCKLMSLKIFDF